MNTGIPTAALAAEINAEHSHANAYAREALNHARRAGDLLLQAKAAVDHGDWLPWLAANVAFSDRTARGYMRIASHWTELQSKSATAVADLGLRDALELLAESRPEPKPQPEPSSELDRARDFEAERDKLIFRARICERVLENPKATVEEIAWVCLETTDVQMELVRLRNYAEREFGLLFAYLKEKLNLGDADLLRFMNDGSLAREFEKRIAELGGAA